MQILHEHLAPGLDKYHLNHPDKPSPEFPSDCRPAIHQIYSEFGYPHDHSWDFHTFIMHGAYEEEIYIQDNAGNWSMTRHIRSKGEARFVKAETVHRITRILDGGPCFTCVLHEPLRRSWSYYPDALMS